MKNQKDLAPEYNGHKFAYNNADIGMFIPFHPRVNHLVDKITPNSWAAIFTVALYNLAHDNVNEIDEQQFIYECIMHNEYGYDKRTVAADIAKYLANVRDILVKGYRAQVDEYVARALNIDKVRETTRSGEYTIRKIIHYWLRNELSHLVGRSKHHYRFSDIHNLLLEHGVLLPAIWMETFNMYDETITQPFAGVDLAAPGADSTATLTTISQDTQND